MSLSAVSSELKKQQIKKSSITFRKTELKFNPNKITKIKQKTKKSA